jgi:hypothetical protein
MRVRSQGGDEGDGAKNDEPLIRLDQLADRTPMSGKTGTRTRFRRLRRLIGGPFGGFDLGSQEEKLKFRIYGQIFGVVVFAVPAFAIFAGIGAYEGIYKHALVYGPLFTGVCFLLFAYAIYLSTRGMCVLVKPDGVEVRGFMRNRHVAIEDVETCVAGPVYADDRAVFRIEVLTKSGRRIPTALVTGQTWGDSEIKSVLSQLNNAIEQRARSSRSTPQQTQAGGVSA